MARKLGHRIAALTIALCAAAPTAAAIPIPEGPDASTLPAFIGSPAKPHPVRGTQVPQNPFMAANGKSNLDDDAYMTDRYPRSGPLGPRLPRPPPVPARR